MSRLYELRMMARVAQLYHEQNLKQAEISQRMHLSQATVSRLLAKAGEEGIVRITINAPRGTYPQLEDELLARFGLSEAIVADCYEDNEEAILSAVGNAAAYYFETTLGPDEVIGISCWSSTLLRMVEAIHPLKRSRAEKVVQILGGIGNPTVQSHATQITTRLAALVGADPTLLAAPGVAASSAARLVMLGDGYVRATMEEFRRLTIALVGIGSLEPSYMLHNSGNSFAADELSDLARRGAVGDLCLRFFDASGRAVDSPFDERVIGITLDELKKVPRVIGVAGGAKKTTSIHGALLGGWIDTLITDKFTAERVLKLSAAAR
ncbi:sugar-binding transcriptional regulator [Consotaella salsifontis]|uniref:Transcriptional regulator n=1 Tax=Consotaella salsifontis TaxID=1365950 RepID=A0A1T4RPV8_9HYPH|nr:sugar-binding transcriptional regulator [Consotaella salsifontis]SKA17778.1 transcriptional regulator [Consotaella salsifontis]